MINLLDEKTFEKLGITSEVRTEIIQNKKIDLPVYKIPLSLLKYNKNNGRIFVGFKEYQIDNDLSKLKVEDIEMKIEDIIWSNNKDSNKETFDSIKKFGQLVVGVVLQDGTVLDGNRRFTALRKLSREKSNQDDNQYFKAIIIQTEGDGAFSTRDIRKMELSIQYGQQTKLDYDPIDFAFSIHNDINDKEKNLTVEDLSEVLNKSAKEIQEIVSNADNIIEYLKYYEQTGKTHLAKDLSLYYPILELTKFLNKNSYSPVETKKIRRVFFDVFTAVKHKTPQQSLRTELVEMIFKDKSEFDKFSNEFSEIIQKEFKTNLSSNKDDFDQFFKKYKESATCSNLSNWYKDYLEGIRLKNEGDSIPKTIQKAIDLILKIDVVAFKGIENSNAKRLSSEIDKKLQELDRITVRLIKKINE